MAQGSYPDARRTLDAMGENLERLKQRIPLLEDTQPSFYVNTRKNLFYCHGCGRGGDLIRFVELLRHLSFRESVTYLHEELAPTAQLLAHTAAFYQLELHRYPEGVQYLAERGVHDARL